VRALTLVIRQALQQRRRVEVLTEGEEIHAAAVELAEPVHEEPGSSNSALSLEILGIFMASCSSL
jgi:hypothetical protein